MSAITVMCSGYTAVSSPASANLGADAIKTAIADGPAASLVAAIHTTDSDTARTSSSFPIRGVLVDEAGAFIPNADVQVDLYPGPSLMKKTVETHVPALNVPLGFTKTDVKGAFTLQVPALRNITDYLFRDGNVRLLVSSVDANHSLFYDVTAALPRAVNAQAIVPVADGSVVGAADGAREPGQQALRTGRPGIGASGPSAAKDSTERNIALSDLLLRADTTTAPGVRVAAANPDPARLCLESVGVQVYGWQLEGWGNAVESPLQAVYTLGKAKVKYEWDDVNAYEVTTAFELSYKQAKLKGGFSKTWEGGIGGAANIPQNFAGYIRTRVEHRLQYLYCYNPRATYAGVEQSVPYNMIGGAENFRDAKAKVACKAGIDHALISPGNSVKVSKKATTKINAGLSLLGVSLDTSMTNNASNTKTFENAGKTNTYICGNNDYVANAAIVREVAN